MNRGTIDGGEGTLAKNRFRRIAYQGRELEALLAYPQECAKKIVARARAVMLETGLERVYFASDLVDGMMPELQASYPATIPPLMQPVSLSRSHSRAVSICVHAFTKLSTHALT